VHNNAYHSRSSKVVDFGTNCMRIWDFLLVLKSNLSDILLPFRDIGAFVHRKRLFRTLPLSWKNFWGVPLAVLDM